MKSQIKVFRTPESEPNQNPVRVFVAEDNAVDVFWLEMVFKSARLPYQIELAVDAVAAKDYVESWKQENNIAPEMILLDVNLPGASISEVLDCLSEALTIPLFMISGTEVPRHLRSRVGEDRCLQKPMTHEQLLECLASAGLLARFEAIQ